MSPNPSDLGGKLLALLALVGLVVGSIAAGSFADGSLQLPLVGSLTSQGISVSVSASGEIVCSATTSHRVTADWEVTGADSPDVTIRLILPDGTTQTATRNTARGQVVFDLTLEGGGTLDVEVEASVGGSTAFASTTVTVSPCGFAGFDPEPKWRGRDTDDPDFHAPPVGTDGKPFGKDVQAQGATNIVGAQYEDDRITFQVQGTPGQQQQYGVNQDCDQDGIGETWTWVFPGQRQAVVTGPDLEIQREVPVQRQAGEFGVQAQGSDCAVIVASFQRQIGGQTEGTGKGVGQRRVQVGEQIEQVGLNTTAQAIMVEGTQRQQQSGTGQQQQQQDSLKDKFCPARNRDTLRDVNGDGDPDIFYPENVREYENVRIEVWCISNNTFGKKVTHRVDDGDPSTLEKGWVGKCPYVGGQNRQTVIDTDNDGRPDVIRRTIVDGGSDDDGDGKTDAMVYEYDIDTHQHTATLYEDGRAVRSESHRGPYRSVGALPFFRNAAP